MLLWLLHTLGPWLADHGLYRYFGVLDQIQFRALGAAGLAFAVVIALGRRTIAFLARMKIGDAGLSDAEALRRVTASKANTPTMGGVLIVGAIALSVLVLGDLASSYVHLGLVVMLWLAAVGAADDWLKLTSARRGSRSRQGLYAWEKLVFQLGIGLLAGWFAFNYGSAAASPAMPHALNLPFQKTYVLVPPEQAALGPSAAFPAQPGALATTPPATPQTASASPAPSAPAAADSQAQPSASPSADPSPAQTAQALISGRVLDENPAVWILSRGAFVLLAMLVITGLSNACNITDGMDGLAGGISGIVATGLVVLALVAGDIDSAGFLLVPFVPGAEELSVMVGAMVGACLGFLWWNASPAQVFMGDTGALSLGGLIGYVSVVVRQEVVVLLLCGVFLLEIASVILQVGCFKLTGGKRIFRVAPLHHHFHLGGWTEQQVVTRAWIVSVLLMLMALASLKLR
ncbi:MAG: phospho-N-acetylmuramoyl-pentapeptide-transferase [Planctomycetota bacterium]|nr:phospho-N-acetylmuramoyl-pentapeptide-transferase [Planctomycetota bacterium]